MKKLVLIGLWTVTALAVVMLVWNAAHFWGNPDMTYQRLIIRYWPHYVIGWVSLIVTYFGWMFYTKKY